MVREITADGLLKSDKDRSSRTGVLWLDEDRALLGGVCYVLLEMDSIQLRTPQNGILAMDFLQWRLHAIENSADEKRCKIVK